MANYIPEDIDFSLYMNMSEAKAHVIPANAYVDDVIDKFYGAGAAPGDVLPWRKTQEKIQFFPGQVTLWTGYSASGKSMVLNQAVIGFLAQGKRVCIASMEMPIVDNLTRMSKQVAGTAKPSEQFIRDFFAERTGNLWMYAQQGTVSTERMLAVVRYFADELKGQHFIVDSLMKCGVPESGDKSYTLQANFVDQLTAIARDTGMHIHLVAHSRKDKDESSPPNKQDVKGSGTMTDLVHNVLVVWRNKRKEAEAAEGRASPNEYDTLLICEKQRTLGWEGMMALWYHLPSQRYFEDDRRIVVDLFDPRVYA